MKAYFGINSEEKHELVAFLNHAVANNYALYINTLNCHWNVEDPRFIALHKMFESQYEALAESGDLLAERIRQMGYKVKASVKSFAEKADFESIDEHSSADEMIAQLAISHEKTTLSFRKLSELAEKYSDYGLVDLLGSLIREHEKTAWFLRSHLNI